MEKELKEILDSMLSDILNKIAKTVGTKPKEVVNLNVNDRIDQSSLAIQSLWQKRKEEMLIELIAEA